MQAKPHRRGQRPAARRWRKLNDGQPLQCHKVQLHNGDTFVGVRVACGTAIHQYHVDSPSMQRRVPVCAIKSVHEVTLSDPPTVHYVSMQAGMIGKHERAVYVRPNRDPCPVGLYYQGSKAPRCYAGWNALFSPPTTTDQHTSSRADPQSVADMVTLLCKADGRNLHVTLETTDSGAVAHVPVEHWDEFISIVIESDVGHWFNVHDVTVTQFAPEKKDRDTEQWNIDPNATLADKTNPLKVGPSWKSTVERYWCLGDFPAPFDKSRTYTWQQLAKVCYEMLLYDRTPSLALGGDLVLPEPFASYLKERGWEERRQEGTQQLESSWSMQWVVKRATSRAWKKDHVCAQPQLGRAQIRQMYAASHLVHVDHAAPLDADQLSCAKLTLFLYRLAGFYVRIRRNYRKTGQTSRMKGATRHWHDEATKRIYQNLSNLKHSVADKLVGDLNGTLLSHTEPEYRGKYPERQPLGTQIYRAIQKRRNTDEDCVADAALLRKCSKKSRACGTSEQADEILHRVGGVHGRLDAVHGP